MTRLYEFRGTRYLLRELSEMSGVERNVIHARLHDGWTLEQALCIPTPKQRRAGVVFNFAPFEGTGAGSTAQEISEITFSQKTENA
ncbi:hypothetical protein FJ959_07345 [Mesorhizobium sp. B2-2-4]|uniref:hypothetical protein n=1 Tax=unclassified Mesorhizobium TaxID=325217 RepID=UPI0011278C46|nr:MULTISPECIES: hypothetical protein [unclassified Mesorhizobium]TPM61100.1 hypothetical protein FJ959_07345 [Mesorhizobium sp. B2-2-4]TPM70532.1 hypothetical protein FJ965_01815 [Mesorhizobium sp. B2-2-1]TPN70384.1 hypothetical protein FJ984_07795 [Mesorhizobium sp. B1-1-3]